MKKLGIITVFALAVLLVLISMRQPVEQIIEEQPLQTPAVTPTITFVTSDQVSTILGISFPPVSDAQDLVFTEAQLETLNIGSIRIAEDWAFREPAPGEFNWSPLDLRMAWVVQNDISLLLTIQSNGPDWACDPGMQNERSCVFLDAAQFREYITALLARYPGQIAKIQFGNEWLSDYWYPGGAEEFTIFNNILFDAVQESSPDTQVVLGGFATGQLQRLAFCDGLVDRFYTIDGELVTTEDLNYCQTDEYLSDKQRFDYVIANARFDLIDLHFYDDVENWVAYYLAVMAYFPAETPVIVSEFGGPNLFYEQPYSDQYQADRLTQYIETLRTLGISEAYYFKLVQSDSAHPSHQESGLFRLEGGQPVAKPAFYVFQQYSLGW